MDGLKYAKSEGRHIAYRIHDGAADHDLVLFTPGGTVPMDSLENDRIGARLVSGLRELGRLLVFDRRGIGLFDPITHWDRPLVEQWADDLATVIQASELDRPILVALGDYWGHARLFAGRHQEVLGGLVLYEPNGPTKPVDLRRSAANEEESDWIAYVCPTRVDDVTFRQWFDIAGRTGASPAVAARLYDRPDDACVQAIIKVQSPICVPTLVLRRPANLVGSPSPPDPVSSAIHDCPQVDLPGRDYHWLGEDVDSLLAEISRLVTGEARVPPPERVLCAVVFTDLVGSTNRAIAVGDLRWKVALDRHDAVIRELVERSGGTVVKTTGDGVLAVLPSGDSALRVAAAIRSRLDDQDLVVRIGVHVGDVERRGDDVGGIGVHVAARVMSLAGPREILVTAPLPIVALGAEHEFVPHGQVALKGVPGDWDLFVYVASDGGTPAGDL